MTYLSAIAPCDLTCDSCGCEISEGAEYHKVLDENSVNIGGVHIECEAV